MHIAVCDDTFDERTSLSALLNTYQQQRNGSFSYELFHSAIELLDAMQSKSYDVLLLDILMPGMNGMEAAEEIRRFNPHISILFLTSSREFAIESYRVHAADYLLKPFDAEQLFKALDRQAQRLLQEETHLILKTKSGIVKLPLSQLVFVEVRNHHVFFFQTDGTSLAVFGRLSDYEPMLQSNGNYYKPHRSYIINFQYVTGLNSNGFSTSIQKTVPITRTLFAKAKAAYLQYLLTGQTEVSSCFS